jgi:hypothetical protein
LQRNVDLQAPGVYFCKKKFMKTLVLEISEHKKKEFGLLLQELRRLNIRILSIDGKAVTDNEQSAQIAQTPSEGTEVYARATPEKGAVATKKTTRSARKPGKEADKTGKPQPWHFSNHVFPGVETKTFSREEIYEDAEWEKNLH